MRMQLFVIAEAGGEAYEFELKPEDNAARAIDLRAFPSTPSSLIGAAL